MAQCRTEKTSASQGKVTEEDLHKGFESNYGPRVEVQAIGVGQYAASPTSVGHGTQQQHDAGFW